MGRDKLFLECRGRSLLSARLKILLTRNIERLKGRIPSQIVAGYGPDAMVTNALHFDLNDTSGLSVFPGRLFLANREEAAGARQ